MRGRTSHHRRDGNHHELTELAEGLGCYVIDTSQVGHGAPDVFVHYNGRGFELDELTGVWFPVEFKRPGERLRPSQEDLQRKVPVKTWRVPEDVYRTLGYIA